MRLAPRWGWARRGRMGDGSLEKMYISEGPASWTHQWGRCESCSSGNRHGPNTITGSQSSASEVGAKRAVVSDLRPGRSLLRPFNHSIKSRKRGRPPVPSFLSSTAAYRQASSPATVLSCRISPPRSPRLRCQSHPRCKTRAVTRSSLSRKPPRGLASTFLLHRRTISSTIRRSHNHRRSPEFIAFPTPPRPSNYVDRDQNGDTDSTDVMFGRRVSKRTARRGLWRVDELNTARGLARTLFNDLESRRSPPRKPEGVVALMV